MWKRANASGTQKRTEMHWNGLMNGIGMRDTLTDVKRQMTYTMGV